jgi:hypothetical protein
MLISKMLSNSNAFMVGGKFRTLLDGTILDLGRADQDTVENRDHEHCAQTLRLAHLRLCTVADDSSDRPRKATGISKESLRMTIAGILSVAQKLLAEYVALVENEDTTPDDIGRWLTDRGQRGLNALAILIGTLLSEENLHKALTRTDPSIS